MTSAAAQLSAHARWPNVPACYGWLSLARRGDWRLQGERVTHRGLIEFMNRQYASDEAGRWFVQNGPQRVYVDLAATPWIFHRDGATFVAHTGAPAGAIKAVLIDGDGSLYLDAALGIGLLDGRDLATFFEECRPHDEASLLCLMAGNGGEIRWQDLPLQYIAADRLAQRYAYLKQPRP